MSDLDKVAGLGRLLDGLSDADSRRVLTALVSHLISSFRNKSERIKWIGAFEKTVRKWQAET